MALLKCIECNSEVSEFADTCPKCGCPVSKTKTERDKIIQNLDDVVTCPLCKVKRNKSDIIKNNNKCMVCGYDYTMTEDEFEKMKDKSRKSTSSSSQPQNVPKCPTCGSTNIEKISAGKKMTGAFLFGVFSSDIRNTMHCKDCGHKW